MKTSTQKIINHAMQLDPSARAMVAETLLESLDLGADFEVSEAWRTEIQRRCAEIDGGAVTMIPGDQALAGLRAKYGQWPPAGIPTPWPRRTPRPSSTATSVANSPPGS